MIENGMCVVNMCRFLGSKSEIRSFANEHSSVFPFSVYLYGLVCNNGPVSILVLCKLGLVCKRVLKGFSMELTKGKIVKK